MLVVITQFNSVMKILNELRIFRDGCVTSLSSSCSYPGLLEGVRCLAVGYFVCFVCSSIKHGLINRNKAVSVKFLTFTPALGWVKFRFTSPNFPSS